MAITQNTYTGNGSTVLYSFAFPYLNTADVKVSLNGTITTAYTFANATTIQFNTAPANGAAIRIYRETNDASLQAVLSPGSSIRASDLNDNFDQLIYLGQEANTEADSATATANTALTNSATAISTANTASTNASAAVSTANTASANASAAVTTANTASTNASNAVSTANTASTNATTALNTANSATTTANNATSTANTALSTANTALTNANAAVSTANTASTNANNAVSTANTASTNATNAVNTANTASTNATTAVNTANSAVTTANAAAAAVANAVLYTTVANVAAIPGSPSNNTAIEVTNSTGIESFTPLSGLPAGFVGSSGLSVRIIYQTAGATWTWIQYFPNDPETRYFKLSGGTITGPITVPQGTVSSPGVKFSGTGNDNTGVYSPGIDELGLVTNGVNRLAIDSAGAVSIPGTLGVTGAVTGTSTVSGSALIPTGSSVPTNGVYLPAANTVGISTGGSGRLFVNSNGNISVGTTTNDSVGSTTTLTIDRSAGNGQLSLAANGTVRGRVFAETSDGNFYIGNPSAGGLLLFTNNSERLRITSAGLVGVGTSSPSSALSVYPGATGNIALLDAGGTERSRFFINNNSGSFNTGIRTDNYYLDFDSSGAAQNQIRFFTGTGAIGTGTQRMVIDSSGRVGIGTSSPGAKLDVWPASSDAAFRGNSGVSTQVPAFEFRGYNSNATNGGLDIRTNLNGAFADRVRITNDGLVGIGTTSPSRVLHAYSTSVNAVAQFQSSQNYSTIEFVSAVNTNSVTMGADGAGNGYIENKDTSKAINFVTGGSERARIDSSGRWLLGTSSVSNGGAGAFINRTSGTSGTSSLFRGGSWSMYSISGEPALVLSSNINTSGAPTASETARGGIGFEFVSGAEPTRFVIGTVTASSTPCPVTFWTEGTERLRIASNGAWGLAGANYGSSGQVLTSNGSGSAPTWSTASGGITLATSVATTSGTSVDFTGIPSTVKAITVMYSLVSTNGNGTPRVQLGTSGGVTTSGYAGTSKGSGNTNLSAGFDVGNGFASSSNVFSGQFHIRLLSGNTWTANGMLGVSTTGADIGWCSGTVTLGATLDRIRFTNTGGDTFDAGSVNIMYES